MILFLSINVISANEINDNDLNSIDTTDAIGIDSVENADDISSSVTDNQEEENSQSDVLSESQSNENYGDSGSTEQLASDNEGSVDSDDNADLSLEETKGNTSISVSKTSIKRGTTLYIYLKDNNGNPISGKSLLLDIGGNKYNKTTDANGAVTLKFNSFLGKYTLKVNFNGDSEYLSSAESFDINIYQVKTSITVASESVARGKYLYAYLKDSSGNALAGQTVKIRFNGKTFTKVTNSKGRVSLKIPSVAAKYLTKITYAGNTSYKASNKSFYLNVYRTKTNITVKSTSVVRGKYLYAYLKDKKGNPLVNKTIRIRFNGKNFYKKTNSNGRVSLKINSKSGYYTTSIIYAGSGYYKPFTKSFKLRSYIAKTKLTVANATVVRGKYFYAYLKDSSNRAVSGEKVVITFDGKKFTKTTNSNGRVSLKINSVPSSYKVKLNHAASIGYAASSKSLTVKILTNATAKIIIKASTSGEFTIKLTDMAGNPLANQKVTIKTYKGNQSAGSGVKVTKKTIILDTDSIWSNSPYTKEYKFLNDIASILRSKGYNVIVSDVGPNAHCTDIKKYQNACIFCIFSGVCAGTLDDMASDWYQYYLNKNDLQIKIGVYNTSKINLATEDYLVRAHDDNFSDLPGLANPGTFINNQGWDYVYGASATEMANNFLTYAVNGLSIGKDNTLPCITNTYTVTTNENGLATISGLTSGKYKITTSYSNPALGYIADTVTTTLIV